MLVQQLSFCSSPLHLHFPSFLHPLTFLPSSSPLSPSPRSLPSLPSSPPLSPSPRSLPSLPSSSSSFTHCIISSLPVLLHPLVRMEEGQVSSVSVTRPTRRLAWLGRLAGAGERRWRKRVLVNEDCGRRNRVVVNGDGGRRKVEKQGGGGGVEEVLVMVEDGDGEHVGELRWWC
ncbi:hypothetical protein Pcinc_025774 [Petrolisthes cinctipes]|uniref:Uncharacterized protein n=1 Tax=Petrolisthes cinctipes TaxID=88211 RepID=A0AAE1K8Z7_PETCI|nr:hypothetical protein Pcinc_025774 [Petrolisthes cinctipes]